MITFSNVIGYVGSLLGTGELPNAPFAIKWQLLPHGWHTLDIECKGVLSVEV